MFDWYALINRYITFPLYYWKNNDRRLERLDEIEQHQYMASDALAELQLSRVQRMVDYAFHHTRYYRKVM